MTIWDFVTDAGYVTLGIVIGWELRNHIGIKFGKPKETEFRKLNVRAK
jgi:hypothetical protein